MKFILLILLPILALTWRDVGHLLTSSIAQIRLKEINPEAGNLFFNLVNSINDLCDNRTRSFVESACWPDDIKQTRNMTLWDSWHFINPPYLTDTVGPIVNQTANIVNVIATLNQTASVLKINLEKHTAERALFARFLVHLTGDIHQPLHASSLFNRSFPSGDLGGNLIEVYLQGEKKNFHHFWDTGAYYLENSSWFIVRPMDQSNKTALHSRASSMIKQYGCEVENLSKNIDPLTWSEQSFEFSKNTTYPFVLKTANITEQYRALAYKTVLKRITLAGYRLANYVINLYQAIVPPNKIGSICPKNKSKKEQESTQSQSKQKKQRFKRRFQLRKNRKIEENL